MAGDSAGEHAITITKEKLSVAKEFERDAMTDARRRELARLIVERGFVRVTEAADELGVSEVTVRADLGTLEAAGGIVRVHGGAMPAAAVRESSLEASLDRDAAAKRAIGRAAADLVSSGESLYLDAGSTAMALADALVARRELHDIVVATSGLTVALALESAIPRFTVIVIGGTLRPLQHSLVNPFAAPMIESLRFDTAFIGCNGVDPEAGVTNRGLPDAEVKRLAIRASRRRVIIADGTKIGRVDLAHIAPVDAFDELVTAGEVDAAVAERLDVNIRICG